jgi:hypothetical protein
MSTRPTYIHYPLYTDGILLYDLRIGGLAILENSRWKQNKKESGEFTSQPMFCCKIGPTAGKRAKKTGHILSAAFRRLLLAGVLVGGESFKFSKTL